MTQTQEQKLAGYLKFQEQLSQNPEVLDNYPHLKPLYDLFHQRLTLILKTKQMLDNYVQNIAIRNELIKTTASYSRKITSFALLEDITELQGMGFSVVELNEIKDQQLLKICQMVLGKCEDFCNDLVDYEINSIVLKAFRNQIDQFSAIIYNSEISSDLVDQTFEEFSDLFKEADEILNNKLTAIITENSPEH